MRRAAVIASLLALACGTPRTEVLVVIDTNLEVPGELDRVRVDLIGPGGEPRTSEGFVRGPEDLPLTVGLVDERHAAREVRVTVTGLRNDANVIQRRAVFAFVPHETRILRIDLLRECVGVGCPSDQTCGENGCRPIEVTPQELVPYDPAAVARRDGGAQPDGSTTDGGCVATEEVCDGRDDDCDGRVDEDIDLESDPLHCGACDNACPVDPENAASACVGGTCTLRCDEGFEDCDDEAPTGCEAVLSKPQHCGSCGLRCEGATPFCQPGDAGFACVESCEAGTTDCAGACVDVTSDPLRCGGCDVRCAAPANAVATCMAGACGFECDEGFADCDGDPSNGCESTLHELENCGGCGMRCERPGAVTSCASGSCETVGCQPARGDCDGDASNGCEADLSTPARCGSCTNACPTGVAQGSVACVMGSCRLTCIPGFGNCDSMIANGCERSLSSAGACGMCGVSCADPTPFCTSVASGYACTDGCGTSELCGGSCVDTSRDPLHCGGCDRPCASAPNAIATCTGGSCGLTCAEGYDDCDGDMDNGCEVFLASDPTRCGSCENACTTPPNASATCAMGSCGFACQGSYGDCNAPSADGCETDLGTSVSSCGVCGNACGLRPGATAVECAAGACRVVSCEADLADCDGTFANGCEVDTTVNRNHCGACGNACAPGRRCCGGMCRRNSEC